MIYFVGTVYWTSSVVRQFGGLPAVVAVLLMLLLAAYLALYPAVFALAVQRAAAGLGTGPALLVAPAVWVTTELGRAHLFTGFPWVLLGYSQATVVPVAQLASLFGVYGLSLLLASVSAALAYAALPGRGRGRWGPIAAALLAVAAVAAWGTVRVRDGALTREGTAYPVALVQGNIAQEQKWDPARAPMILQRYLEMSRQAAAAGAKLIVWPESSLPFFLQEDPAGGAAVRRLAVETGASLLVGSDQVERNATPARYFNAAFLVTPDGTIGAIYRKVHLVPFGEYVPLKKLLFFAGPLVEAVSDFSPGDAPVMLPVGGHLASTAICYEVVYPELARQAVAMGSQLLTTITNDAWYGRSSAPWQHFEQASLRAVEQGRYLARSANTGVSGIVDPYGRVVARSGIFEQTTLLGDVRFLDGRTVYSRIGDVLAYGCGLLALGALLAARRAPTKRTTKRPG